MALPAKVSLRQPPVKPGYGHQPSLANGSFAAAGSRTDHPNRETLRHTASRRGGAIFRLRRLDDCAAAPASPERLGFDQRLMLAEELQFAGVLHSKQFLQEAPAEQ